MTKKVTVITAVHNDGQYLPDVAASLSEQTLQDFDWVIVDDNSSEPQTAQALAEIAKTLPQTSVTIIKQDPTKRGAGAAYRRAMQEASGQYILPIDADDKIAETYLEQATQVLDENPTVGVVYGKARVFGLPRVFNVLYNIGADESMEEGRNLYLPWPLPEYSFPENLAANVVFPSAMFRRADYLETQGYLEELQTQPAFGLWVSLTELALQRNLNPDEFFQCLPDVVYFYRQRLESTNHTVGRAGYVAAWETIFRKHQALYEKYIDVVFARLLILQGFPEA